MRILDLGGKWLVGRWPLSFLRATDTEGFALSRTPRVQDGGVAWLLALFAVGALPSTVWAARHPGAATPWWWAGVALLGVALLLAIAILLSVVVRSRLIGSTIVLVVAGTAAVYVAVYDGWSLSYATIVRHRYLLPLAAATISVGVVGVLAGRLQARGVAATMGVLSLIVHAAVGGKVLTARAVGRQAATPLVQVLSAARDGILLDTLAVIDVLARGAETMETGGRRYRVLRPGGRPREVARRVQGALNAARGGEGVLLASGTWPVDTSLVIPSGVVLAGAGGGRTVIRATPTGQYSGGIIVGQPGTRGIAVLQLGVDGVRSDRPAGADEAGILFRGVADGSLQGIVVRATSGDCVRISDGSVDGWVDRSRLDDCGAEETGTHGLHLSSPTETMYWTNRTPATTCRHVLTRNYVTRARNTGIMLYNVCDVLVVANHVADSRLARGINAGPTTGWVVIAGNLVERAHSTGIHFYASSDALVVGNTVVGTVADGSGRGIEGQGIKGYVASRGFRIWGNVVRGNATDGIALLAGAGRAVIGGNIITDNGRDGIRLWAGAPGGLPPGDVEDVVLTGNVVSSNRGSGLFVAGISGRRVRGVRVDANVFAANAGAMVHAEHNVCEFVLDSNTLASMTNAAGSAIAAPCR